MTRYFMRDTPLCQMEQQMMTPPYFKPRGHGRYMDMLQLEESEYNLIKFPQRGVCLYKCGNERYLLEVHAPAYKEKLFGTAGGR